MADETKPTTDGGTALPTTNAVAEGIDTVISGGATVAEKAVETAAESAQPWLAFPVIKQLFQALVSWIIGILSKTGQLLSTKAVTTVQGSLEDSALVRANQEVVDAIQTGDPAKIAAAESDFQKAQSSAVNTDGSAPPQ